MPGDAPRVEFLPGFMQHADSWSEVAAAVGQRYPSEVLDFATWTFEERLGEISAAAPPGSVLVGYSMGGRLALHAALRDPGRYRALALVGASPGIADDGARERRRVADEELAAWIEAHSIEEVVARWEANPVFSLQPAEVVAAQRAGRLRHEPSDLATLLRSAGQGALDPVWDRLGELSMPVLAVAGAHDSMYVETGGRMARLGRRVTAAAIADAGHAAHLEQPAAVRDVIRPFIERFVAL
jgi:2-succinyl-6-hydroxy-2,4-cyclohexadiene-1-carboxylate synthase